MRENYPQMMKQCFNVKHVGIGERLKEIKKKKIDASGFFLCDRNSLLAACHVMMKQFRFRGIVPKPSTT